jgi:predicted NBD/HSP70 family sugar kinase
MTEPLRLSPNERRALGHLFRSGVATQIAVASALDLTQQSASRIIARLTDSGLIATGDRIRAGKRGYPSTALALANDYTHSFGVSLRSDGVGLTLTDLLGNVLAHAQIEHDAPSIQATLDWCASTMPVMADKVSTGSRCAGIGVAVAGSAMAAGGFNTTQQLEEWAGHDIARIFADRFARPSYADNDGNLAALAESLRGVGQRHRSFAYLYIASGVGGGIVLDGRLWRGRHGNAGEFAGGLPSEIYPFPNLEILRRLLAAEGVNFETVSAMVANYDDTWRANDRWVERVTDSVSLIASNASAILDIDAIVLGGLLPHALAERLIPKVTFYDQHRRGLSRPTPTLIAAEYDGDPACTGAALMPLLAAFFD